MAATDSTRRAHNFKDLTGRDDLGRWTVLSFAGTKSLRAYWLCRCECGTTKEVCGNDLVRGTSQSCGCFQREKCTTHGGHETPEYMAWVNIKSRCCNPNNPGWSDYGGRGITMCERWEDFALFLQDVGARPSPDHSIDRYPNNDGNYEPGNVRWATINEQNRNTRANMAVTFQGRTQCLAAWAEELGMVAATLSTRLKRGWSVERAIATPPGRYCRASISSAQPSL